MAAIYLYKLFSWALGGWKRKGHRWSHRERELSLPLPTREEIPPSGWQFFIFLSHFAQTFSTRSPINYSRRRLFSEKSLKAVMLLRLIIKSQIYMIYNLCSLLIIKYNLFKDIFILSITLCNINLLQKLVRVLISQAFTYLQQSRKCRGESLVGVGGAIPRARRRGAPACGGLRRHFPLNGQERRLGFTTRPFSRKPAGGGGCRVVA